MCFSTLILPHRPALFLNQPAPPTPTPSPLSLPLSRSLSVVSLAPILPVSLSLHLGTSLIRNNAPLRPYRRHMPRVLRRSEGEGRFLMGEVPL